MGFQLDQSNPMMQMLMEAFSQQGGQQQPQSSLQYPGQPDPMQGGGGGLQASQAYQPQAYQPNSGDGYMGTTPLGQKLQLESLFQPTQISPQASGINLVGPAITNTLGRMLNMMYMQKMMKQEEQAYQGQAGAKSASDALKRQLIESQILKNQAQATKAGNSGGKGSKGGGKGGSNTFSVPNAGPPPA